MIRKESTTETMAAIGV